MVQAVLDSAWLFRGWLLAVGDSTSLFRKTLLLLGLGLGAVFVQQLEGLSGLVAVENVLELRQRWGNFEPPGLY